MSDHPSLAPILLRASAGTGKTYQLTGRLLTILFQGAAPETILATTFTRKAAGEITNRVLVDLAAAATSADDRGLAKLRDQLHRPDLQQQDCLRQFDNLLRNIHRFRVCTLDSLFSQLARSFPFELNLPPAWRLTDEIEEVWFRERAIDTLIATAEHNELPTLLSMLGKGEMRRSIVRELISVVEAAYSASRAAGEQAWDKIGVNRQPTPADVQRAISDFQAASPKQKTLQAVLSKFVDAMSSADFGLLEQETLIKNIAKARYLGSEVKFGRSTFPEGLEQAFDTLYAAVRSQFLARLRAQNQATATVLTAYDQHLTNIKQSARALSFEDITVRLAEQFANLDQRSLIDRMDGAIDHILLDEFQDTSPLQWQVLRPLAIRVTEPQQTTTDSGDKSPTARSFFCVGDTKQAIYGWRGGVAEIFDAVADQLPGITTDDLNTSRRSSPVVIEFVNCVFENIAEHPRAKNGQTGDLTDNDFDFATALRRFADAFPINDTAQTELAGFVRLETVNRDGDGSEPATFCRAAALAKEIHAADPTKTIGILTRSNDGIRSVMSEFRKFGVAASQEGGNPLTDSAAVELILSALMMSEHPGDKRWSFHTHHSPLAQLPDFGPDLIRDWITDVGIAETIERLADSLAPVCDARDSIRLRQLVQLSISYDTGTAPRVRDFVRMVRQKRVERPQAAQIRVMTVHQSKGLEFDAVILPQLDADLSRASGQCIAQVPRLGDPPAALTRYVGKDFWHFLSADWQQAFRDHAQQSITEAICLLYVAITRARQAVYMLLPPASKAAYEDKQAGALIYHALGAPTEPDQENVILYQSGNPDWVTCR